MEEGNIVEGAIIWREKYLEGKLFRGTKYLVEKLFRRPVQHSDSICYIRAFNLVKVVTVVTLLKAL